MPYRCELCDCDADHSVVDLVEILPDFVEGKGFFARWESRVIHLCDRHKRDAQEVRRQWREEDYKTVLREKAPHLLKAE